MPSLSIIIPVYNVEKYLKQCLDSVLVDNKFTGQVICVNDGSTDGSSRILEEYAAKYANIEIISQPNAGLSAARNAGLRNATGDYVFFPDSDDWIFPNSIDKIMSNIDGEDVVYFNARVFSEEKQCFGSEIAIPNIKNMDGQAYFAAIYGKPRNMPCVCVCGGVYLRSFLINNHLYNEPGIYHEDNYFTPQVLLVAQSVSSINEYVYAYRVRKGSITAHITEKHIRDLLFITRSLNSKYLLLPNVNQVFYEGIKDVYLQIINEGYDNGIDVKSLWRFSDTKILNKCALDERCRKAARICYLSPYLTYLYMQNAMPVRLRKLVNKVL